jgi:CheY-like chemotaxis protein
VYKFYSVAFVVTAPTVSKRKILVADDNSEIRRLLVLHLGQSGYDTFEASTGHAAVEEAHATLPDLIIMDLAMPDGTGDEAIASLKADTLTRDIPVIVLTASLYGVLVDRALAAGATEVVHKPVTFKYLNAVLQRHLSVQRRRHQIVDA